MEDAATRQHAHPNTVYHCLYAYYYLSYSKQALAYVFNKCERTVSNWIRIYEKTGSVSRKQGTARKFNLSQRAWLFEFYQQHPLAYLDEAQDAFKRAHGVAVSKTTIWRLLREMGLTWKVLERRAMHVKENDITRFMEELANIDWSHDNIVFLDEVSFDNRGMLRKRGYAIKGKKVAIRGEFVCKPRVSILAFIGVHGAIDYFNTEGTFDRVEFTHCCKEFVYSSHASIQQYPGRNSVWIMDGATIHRHPEIVHFLRSVGVVPIFLPAYCPFFNPLEVMFGYMKKAFQRHYVESTTRDLMPFVVRIFRQFQSFEMKRVFEHCGWMLQGYFNPARALARKFQRFRSSTETHPVRVVPDQDDAVQVTGHVEERQQDESDVDELGFTELD